MSPLANAILITIFTNDKSSKLTDLRNTNHTQAQGLRSIGRMAAVLPGRNPTDRKVWLIKYLGRNYPGLTVCKAAWKKARAGIAVKKIYGIIRYIITFIIITHFARKVSYLRDTLPGTETTFQALVESTVFLLTML